MQTLPHVVFHHMAPSPALEAAIRHEIDELERFYDRCTSCRVVVTSPVGQARHGRAFEVHVDLHLPGVDLIAGRSSHEDAEHEDAHLAVRDAFRAIRRQLEHQLGRRAANIR